MPKFGGQSMYRETSHDCTCTKASALQRLLDDARVIHVAPAAGELCKEPNACRPASLRRQGYAGHTCVMYLYRSGPPCCRSAVDVLICAMQKACQHNHDTATAVEHITAAQWGDASLFVPST